MENEEQQPLSNWDYYLEWHILCRAESLLSRAKTVFKFSKIKDEKADMELAKSIEQVYETLGLLYLKNKNQSGSN
jgi:hypothetical protein